MLTVKEVLTNRVVLDIECIDRVYLNSLTGQNLNKQSKFQARIKQASRMPDVSKIGALQPPG